MIHQLSLIVKNIVDEINNQRLSNMKSSSCEAAFESELRNRMSGFNLSSMQFSAGQEEWQNVNALSHSSTNVNYHLAPHRNKVDIVVDTSGFLNLIEIKKIYSNNGKLYKYLYNGGSLKSNQWGDAPIYESSGYKYYTFWHEGQIWQDIIRLLNFGSYHDKRFILGFVQGDGNVTFSNLQQKLMTLISDLQNHFHNCPYWDGHGRIYSQLDQIPKTNSKIYTFLTPKSKSPFWVNWCT